MQQYSREYSRELGLALASVVAVSLLYLGVARTGIPASGSLFGHLLGVAGFVLMLGAATLYTWRKQARSHRWGETRWWLQMHVYIGLVGPWLVLLHSSWRLNGLAGATMILTILMVASGFVCRYLYTGLPRTSEGGEISRPELEAELANLERALQVQTAAEPMAAVVERRMAALAASPIAGDTRSVLLHSLLQWGHHRLLRRELRQLASANRAGATQLGALLERRFRLQSQLGTLVAARHLLALSRAIHVVLGVVLFVLAFVHIGAALYYVTFSR